MQKQKTISGFSKLSKREKLRWVAEHFFKDPEAVTRELMSFWHQDEEQQRILDGFSENTISNFVLPFGVAPNFIINGQNYSIPMVIEESSVVAAASSAAKFWMHRGGFHAEIIGTTKIGQVHFSWHGATEKLKAVLPAMKKRLRADAQSITQNMQKRGGGVLDMQLLDMTHLEEDYYQLQVTFETCDSMGANFINSVLEQFAESLQAFVAEQPSLEEEERQANIIMSILSNYTPECRVRAWVECPVEVMADKKTTADEAQYFAEKFAKAVRIAQIDPHRATTHNKGIFNGIDAVVLATGNDFRAVEACGHTYAARDGQYRSLTHCQIEGGIFRFWLDIPMALGTVGGLTTLHPLVKRSLQLLGNPNAERLMQITATIGLAQNFGAVKSLVTTGIQKGHMKMHLLNILRTFEATKAETQQAVEHFKDHVVSVRAVRDLLQNIRQA